MKKAVPNPIGVRLWRGAAVGGVAAVGALLLTTFTDFRFDDVSIEVFGYSVGALIAIAMLWPVKRKAD